MNDTLTTKALDSSTLDAANFPGTARNFARVQSTKSSEHLRRSLHVGSLSPTDIRISHQYPSKGDVTVRSLVAVEQSLARLDGSSNVIGQDGVAVKLHLERSSGATLAETRTVAMILAGLILESNGAFIDQFYSGEV